MALHGDGEKASELDKCFMDESHVRSRISSVSSILAPAVTDELAPIGQGHHTLNSISTSPRFRDEDCNCRKHRHRCRYPL